MVALRFQIIVPKYGEGTWIFNQKDRDENGKKLGLGIYMYRG